MTKKTESASSGNNHAVLIDLRESRLRALIDRWRDPEFLRVIGASWDSSDCADALEQLLDGEADIKVGKQ